MKGKTILSLAIALSLMLSIIPMMVAHAVPEPKIYVKPEGSTWDTVTSRWELIGPPPGVGATFKTMILIEDVDVSGTFDGIWSWMVRLQWNPAVLAVSGRPAVKEGNFLTNVDPDNTKFSFYDPNNVTGQLPEVTCRFTVELEATGDGTLFEVTFTVLAPGSTEIYVYEYDIVDYEGDYMPTPTLYRGFFEIPPPPPHGPTANFTPASCNQFYVGDFISLVSTSTPGWDTLPDPPAGETVDITEWKWDIDFLNTTVITLYGENIPNAFQCDRPGDVNITLTVNATDMDLPTHPEYDPIASATHTIHQVSRPTGAVIDVWTNKGGEGLGINWDVDPPVEWAWPTAWSDAYAPQEEVTVYAKVTYNEDPVCNKPVAFEVKDPTGAGVVYRTAFTNGSGIATFTYRNIWTCTSGFNSTHNYDVYEIWASVSVSEIAKLDVVKYRYGWLVQIEGIEAPAQVNKDADLTFYVYLKNILHSSDKTVYMTVTVYDECGVPVAVAVLPTLTVPADALYWDPMFTLHIPKWAYRGNGMIYVNLFTAAPQDGGVPVCPEGTSGIWLGSP
jgi:hypothetical protein